MKKKNRLSLVCFFLAWSSLFVMSGCATSMYYHDLIVQGYADDPFPSEPFPMIGTYLDLAMIKSSGLGPCLGPLPLPFSILAFIDLPFSFALDIITLPIPLVWWLVKWMKSCQESEEAKPKDS